MPNIVAWHGKTFNEHVALRDTHAKDGYRFLSLSLYGTPSSPVYAAVMIKRPKIVAQRDWPLLTAGEFQNVFNDQAKKGYGPVIITAAGSASNPRFAAVFQPQKPIPLTRHALRLGDRNSTDESTIQGMNRKAKIDGLMLRWAAVYGDASDPRYAAIWSPNTENHIWNADGALETGAQYQARFDAQTDAWARPSFVTGQKDGRHLSCFVDTQIGPWTARHGLTPKAYQEEFDKLWEKGYFPSVVQAAGNAASSARFAAIWVKRETLTPKSFTAAGPSANADIDNVLKQIMMETPVRHASLAIVKGKKLVYTRGYTYAEPDWPLASPTTRFRMASVSKAICALAIYQLIEKDDLSLDDTVQGILKLKTPAGNGPKDSRFKDVNIRHLLEHTSGINANSYRNGVAVRDAHRTAKPAGTWNLPATAAMTDAYIASLDMWDEDPGDKQEYCNCGYYLLGRVLANKRNRTRPIDALQEFLFDPLNITRIQRARSRMDDQPAAEARYRYSVVGKDDEARLNIGVASSDMSEDRPIAAIGYGHEQYEHQEGSGGLSGSASDLARIVAILISQTDNPALKRDTITTMLDNAVSCGMTYGSRAGHGFDGCGKLSGGKYRAQKGGSLDSSGNVLSFDGDWGLVMNWAGKQIAPYDGKSWYPYFPAVLDIAKKANWGTTDLFPTFGMPSL